ncbi:hypothetical protein [Rhizobium sp. SL86]|uniref:hypothetical protein n=1 Tax=Rhizobium sp. SL86 TaxID=2995148 RepID=UPI0022745769|nr:hypothetical protein [Rhizobium sp. SL86]MCY1669025.1 hypothetical protein [Rhizobium sp. SL86]
MNIRRPRDWFDIALAVLAVSSFLLGTWGFHGLLDEVDKAGDGSWVEAAYRSLQLFFMNFEDPREKVEPICLPLQLARFGAFVTTVWVILKAFFPQVRQTILRLMRRSGTSCALILGYGPVGQAIGAGLRQTDSGIRRITAVERALTPELGARAAMDGVLLLEGDPSDPRLLGHVFARKAERIYVSDSDDLRAIDTAVAVREHAGDAGRDIRVVLNDSAVAGQMAEAAGSGFLGVAGLAWFSLADETARLLMAEARFDRVAVETGAERLHLVILGCGSQGEAIAVETLLTGWRTTLGPPRITFLDRDKAGIEARLRRRMPAWFLKEKGAALPQAARPELDFRACDAETLDFARDACLEGLRDGVTAWVFATGNDALNLRASLSLHRAMAQRRIDPAPIHVRIPSGHAEEAPDLVGQPLAMARTFGAIDAVIARSPLLLPDPDAMPKALHAAYAQASVAMGLAAEPEEWESLSEAKRKANRALFRHAAMKLEDFGAEAQPVLTMPPKADAGLLHRLERVDAALDYARIDRDGDPRGWVAAGKTLADEDAETAIRLRDAAICEHNRWTIERALEQFVPTERPDRALRDDTRRLHNNMHDWYALQQATIRRYDVVMLRGLLSRSGDGSQATARRQRARILFLPVLADGRVGAPHVSDLGAAEGRDVTELQVHLCLAREPADPDACFAALLSALEREFDPERQIPPRRLRFDFARPPGERTLALANRLATELLKRRGSALRIEPLWSWRAEGRTVGVVGHRDLTGFGDRETLVERLRQAFMSLIARHGVEHLVCGYAPGADQLAVKAWTSLGMPAPRLIFPFVQTAEAGGRIFHTDDPSQATPDTQFAETALSRIGAPTLPDSGTGHRAQAETLLARADWIVAVVDESREALAGGTVETVRRAREGGKRVMGVGPE